MLDRHDSSLGKFFLGYQQKERKIQVRTKHDAYVVFVVYVTNLLEQQFLIVFKIQFNKGSMKQKSLFIQTANTLSFLDFYTNFPRAVQLEVHVCSCFKNINLTMFNGFYIKGCEICIAINTKRKFEIKHESSEYYIDILEYV